MFLICCLILWLLGKWGCLFVGIVLMYGVFIFMGRLILDCCVDCLRVESRNLVCFGFLFLMMYFKEVNYLLVFIGLVFGVELEIVFEELFIDLVVGLIILVMDKFFCYVDIVFFVFVNVCVFLICYFIFVFIFFVFKFFVFRFLVVFFEFFIFFVVIGFFLFCFDLCFFLFEILVCLFEMGSEVF